MGVAAADVDPDDLTRAAGAFFVGPYVLRRIGPSGGLSGSDLARVEADGAAWCLRRWPEGFDPRRLRSVHAVLGHSRARGFRGVPRLATTTSGRTVLSRGGALFDAQEWLAGQALAEPAHEARPSPNLVRRLPPHRLTATATGLALFHLSTEDMPPPALLWGPSLFQRLASVEQEVGARLPALRAWATAEVEIDAREVALEWLVRLPAALVRGPGPPASVGARTEGARVVVHGDLWAPHVFFAGEAFSGFVDFEGLTWATPAVDLAQLILHFNGWDERGEVLAAYAAIRPLDPMDEALLPIAALVDLAVEAIWSLGAIAGAHGRAGQRDEHLSNLVALLPSLRAVTR